MFNNFVWHNVTAEKNFLNLYKKNSFYSRKQNYSYLHIKLLVLVQDPKQAVKFVYHGLPPMKALHTIITYAYNRSWENIYVR